MALPPRILNPSSSKIAVIGAGISGLICTRRLHHHGFDVTVFDKGRGVGGRMSTRRTDDLQFDHGCQYITAEDSRFMEEVANWKELGIVEEWLGTFGVLNQGAFTSDTDSNQRYVGVPRMSSVCKHLASNLNVHSNTEVSSIRRNVSYWEVISNGEPLGKFDAVIVSTPPKQAATILGETSEWSTQLHDVDMTPCWTVMVAFKMPLDLDIAGAIVKQNSLAWIGNDSSKPHRSAEHQSWVLQATAEWSQAHLELDPQDIQKQLLSEFSNAVGLPLPEISHLRAHRWRYALSIQDRQQPFFFDPDQLVGLCGDWCNSPKVEGAFVSGGELADRIIQKTKSL